MTNVILHGLLGKKFGERHSFFVRKPVDAIKGLIANKEGFGRALRTWCLEGKYYQIICDGEVINSENTLVKPDQYKQIDIVPALVGASDTMKIVVGIILIIVGFWFAPAGTVGWRMVFGGALKAIGFSLVMSGVMGMLYPAPVPSFESTPQANSFMFSSLQNSQVQGVPVPVGYGRLRIGSKVISTCLRPERLSKGRKRWNGIQGTAHGGEPERGFYVNNLNLGLDGSLMGSWFGGGIGQGGWNDYSAIWGPAWDDFSVLQTENEWSDG